MIKNLLFFAFIAWGDHSLELGIGVDFKLPQNSGSIVDLHAEVQAAFFFNNASRWYVNFGTKQDPISARVIEILTAQTYLMLSSKGIEAGARVQFDLNKHFGPAKVHIYAYVEIGGHISFERPQIGGYLAFGGMIDIEIWIVGITLGLDAILSVEAAKPFLLYAEIRIRVCVRIIVKICKNFTIELKWEKDGTVDRTPIPALPFDNSNAGQQDRTKELIKGVNMLTNEAFDLQYFGTAPGEGQITKIIPLDTYVDIKTAKGLIPNALDAKIGGHVTAAENFTDLISPESVSRGGRQLRQVKHNYSIESIEIKAWNGNQWVDYHPYQAIIEGEVVTNLRIGYWQRAGNQYDTIRILATSPFSYIEAGEPGWFIPEQYGINPSTLFCKTKEEVHHCSNVLNKPIGTIYYPPQQYTAHFINGAYYTLINSVIYDPTGGGIAGLNGNFMKVTDNYNPFGFEKSLSFNNYNSMVIFLPDPSVSIKLQVTTHAEGATVSYYKKIINDVVTEPQYQLVDSVYKTAAELTQILLYENTVTPISKVIIAPVTPNTNARNEVMQQIALLFDNTYQNGIGVMPVTEPADKQKYKALLTQLAKLTAQGCSADNKYFFSDFYGFNDPSVSNIYFKDIVKLSEYYFVAAELSFVIGLGSSPSVIFKINGKGDIVKEKIIDGIITSISTCNNEILLTVKKPNLEVTHLVTPVMLLKLDATLNEVNGIELEPILYNSYEQICPIAGTDFAFWFSSNQVDTFTGGNPAFINGTRILLIDTLSLEIADSVLLPGVIATKAVAKDINSYIFITNKYWQSNKSPVIVVELNDDNTISVTGRYFFDATLNDIAVLQSGEIVVTGRTDNTNEVFAGQFSPDEIDANSKLYAYTNPGFGNENLSLCNSSLQDGQIWIAAYNSANVYLLTMNNGQLTSDFKRLVKPASLKGPDIKIHKIVNNPETKEVYMLSGEPGYYHGEIVSVFDELFNSCLFETTTLIGIFRQRIFPLGDQPVEVEHPVINNTVAGNFLSSSNYLVINNQLCPLIIQPGDTVSCITSLQQICWLTIAQHEYNSTIPGQAAIAQDQQDMVAAMQKTAQPVWRPNTKYYIHFRLKDTVDNGSSSPGLYEYYYGFKTVGPVGHYHLHPEVHYVAPGANADQYPLTSLKQYIDYNRSYPNADGNLLSTKPLFYGNSQCKISIFFAKAFAYHALQKWYAYNGLPELTGEMHIAIKDPMTDVIIPYPLPANWHSETVPLPAGGVTWTGDNDPRIPLHIRMLNNMINYINEHSNTIHCTLTIGQPIKPKAYTYGVTLTNLAPRKLYTAILYNAFETDSNNIIKSEQIHQFVFQTSRYASFDEQVKSYILKDDEGHEKWAVFKIPLTVTPENITTACNIVAGMPDPQNTALETKYAHLFDRVTEGILGLKPTDPAITTEFNLLKDGATGDTIGVLIRNPEPFNIPKIPLQEIAETIAVLKQNGSVDTEYKVLHSKDYAQAFIIHTSKKITAQSLILRFIYKIWNGSAYVTESTVITPQILINI